jgi:GR25 family glycosyltransferase involved in LPS biosynthesis
MRIIKKQQAPTSLKTVKYLYADLYSYFTERFQFRYVNYQVLCRFIDENKYDLIVRRTDSDQGWTDDLQIMIYNTKTHNTDIIDIPPNPDSNKLVMRMYASSITIFEPNDEPTILYDHISPAKDSETPEPIRVDRQTFSRTFNTNIVPNMPHHLYAVGVLDPTNIYIYNASAYQTYYDIYPTIQHIINVAIQYKKYPIYFVISSNDGYIENTYLDRMREVASLPCSDGMVREVATLLHASGDNSHPPIYHKQKYILCQSSQINLPFTLNIPDRHYFYHNLYNSFRSFHTGVPFHEKMNQLVFAGQDRGTKYNFLYNRQIQISQRNYFKTAIAPKYSWIWTNSWIDRQTQIHFKYILDIDGIASTWDATAWKLNSGSVIFKPKSCWRQWFYDKYLPNVHYVEVEDDFSDIESKYQWCEEHPEECEQMIQRCLALFQEVYRYDNVVKHTCNVLDTLMDVSMDAADDMMSNTNCNINKIFYINLDRRSDRKIHIENELNRMGLLHNAERFPGIVHEFDKEEDMLRAQSFVARGLYKDIQHSTGIIGCTRSHLEIFKLAKSRGYEYTMILEDDFEFLVSKEEFDKELNQLFDEKNPLKFDVCMLSYKLVVYDECPETPFVKRVKEAQTASGYIVHGSYLDTLIQLFETTLPLLEKTGQHWLYANDQCWKILQENDLWYAFSKRLGKQIDGYSDNAGKFMSYDF